MDLVVYRGNYIICRWDLVENRGTEEPCALKRLCLAELCSIKIGQDRSALVLMLFSYFPALHISFFGGTIILPFNPLSIFLILYSSIFSSI